MQRLSSDFEDACRARGILTVIGCDEVGRGCLAGPVVAAAVVLPTILPDSAAREIIRDSKTLSRGQRESADAYIRSCGAIFAIGEVSAEEIDTSNIHRASLEAMRRAIAGLAVDVSGAHLALDGSFLIPGVTWSQEAIVQGDGKVLSIAAASIIAKEYRDQLIERLDAEYPTYGFAQHKGYATAVHRKALAEQGLSPIHRRTFCHL